MKTAIFAGSFDPFTIGHKDIADRAKALCDELIIAIGHNERKQYMLSLDDPASPDDLDNLENNQQNTQQ